jgi:hypothetical protein
LAWPKAREATTAPVVGDIVNVPSLFETEDTPVTAAAIDAFTNASVASLAVLSPVVWVVAVVPLGNAGVPLRFAAVPVVFWLKVGKLVRFAALNVGAVWYDGAPAPPLAGPANTEFCAALLRVNDNAGVVVGAATLVVNSGDRLPEENEVTVPDPPPPPTAVKDTLLPITLNVTVALLTKFTLGMTVPFMRTEEPAPIAASIRMKFSMISSGALNKARPRFAE